MPHFQAELRMSQVGGRRDRINIQISAETLEDLKRKLNGVVDLMEPIDLGITGQDKGQPETIVTGRTISTGRHERFIPGDEDE